jgi:glyoxylase-like metal-dependent hydrolase (beta-lactamase superfamily II)
MAASLKKLDKLIPDGAMVYPGHGNIFEYKKGMALAWLDYLN